MVHHDHHDHHYHGSKCFQYERTLPVRQLHGLYKFIVNSYRLSIVYIRTMDVF